jgi:MFS family permease
VAAAHHPGDGLDAKALAIAVQNLSWGILGIFVGMLADRIGAFKVLIGGSVLYAWGWSAWRCLRVPRCSC